eukprot:XP_014022963.1 PREDICTED: myelin-oligodendrocyte glycoprotein-like [Salmo salar]
MKTFPTSAVWCLGILFISVSLITTGSSEVQVVGPADRVVALAGDDIILPCSLKPDVSAENMTVEWTRLNLTTGNVHFYPSGRDSNVGQSPSYKGRTSMFHEELKNGNVSLKLTNVTLSDAGSYMCFIKTLTSQVNETTIQLLVEDLHAVRRHVTVNQTDTNRFTCRVQQPEINHLKETEIDVPGEVFIG